MVMGSGGLTGVGGFGRLAASMSKTALGRGLSALLGASKPPGANSPPAGTGVASAGPTLDHLRTASRSESETGSLGEGGEPGARVERVAVGRVRPSGLQPRRDFPAASLAELAESIREQGILQPLVVRRQGEAWELIAGERRWRAAQLAGLTEVPVIVREADDTTALELMLVENLQREDLNPIDEAQGYAELVERFHLTQEVVAAKVGRSRTAVANALRLLRLPPEVQGMLRERALSAGHAKVILGLPTPDLQGIAARRAVADGLSVRQVEEMVTRMAAPAPVPATATGSVPVVSTRDPHVVAVEDQLRQRLGTRVALHYRQGRGRIDIRFSSDDELERVLEIVGVRLE